MINKTFPHLPGVYFFKDKQSRIIYVGKATSLRDRIRSYFQKDASDLKVKSLIAEYEVVDYLVTNTETEAALLEAQLIREHQPKFNILLKDGQPFVYLMFTNGDLPEIKIVRNKKQKGRYFGPFLQKSQVRKMYAFLMHTFHLNLCNMRIEQGCLNYHLGICAGNCKKDFDTNDYIFRLNLAFDVLDHNEKDFKKKIKEQIAVYTAQFAFEKAKTLYDYLQNTDYIFKVLKARFTEYKYIDEVARVTAPKGMVKDFGALAAQLKEFLAVEKEIRSIDCFDISHFQSKSIVGSCVRFTDGRPDKNKFRKFKIKSLVEQNDYAALQEIVSRRYKDASQLPDLILIDGGKGQLSAVKDSVAGTLCISLAKREETIYQIDQSEGKKLDIHSGVGKLLIALRDYAHHFAITYHRKKQSMLLKEEHESRTIDQREPRTN